MDLEYRYLKDQENKIKSNQNILHICIDEKKKTLD